MSNLAQQIRETSVAPGSVALWWLSQAGFAFKSSAGTVVFLDPYLTDSVERLFGFKRLALPPLRAEEVEADLVLSTHEHADHLDPDGIPVMAQNPRTCFAGSLECLPLYREWGLPEERFFALERGQTYACQDVKITAVLADHGDFAPNGVGLVLDFDGVRIWHTGDTAYRPVAWREIIDSRPDLLLPCINGRFGNMTHVDAAHLARDLGGPVVLPMHFWTFADHNGDPGAFLYACQHFAPQAKPLLLRPGECYVARKEQGVINLRLPLF